MWVLGEEHLLEGTASAKDIAKVELVRGRRVQDEVREVGDRRSKSWVTEKTLL